MRGLKATAVIACNDIPANVSVAVGEECMHLGENIIGKLLPEHVDRVLQVWYENGTLSSKTGCNWTKYVHSARDIQEQNLELTRDNGSLFLRTIRRVVAGEQLLTWYSPVLAIELSIPTLTMSNIIEAGCYKCLRCGYETGYPNILKSHIAFHCHNTVPNSRTMYTRRETEAYETNLTLPPCNQQVRLLLPKATESKLEFETKTDVNVSIKRKGWISGTDYLVRREYSGLKCKVPYTIHNLKQPYPEVPTNVFVAARDLSEINNSKHPCDNKCNMNNFYSNVYNTILQKIVSPNVVLYDDNQGSEHIDSFQNTLLDVSTRKGHRCLYCGKFYSRKYGLKIHLRTHTGYKPLKCKICQRPFGDPSNLNKHVRLHSDGDTPYKCKFCEKVLVRRRDLARHIRSRHLETCL